MEKNKEREYNEATGAGGGASTGAFSGPFFQTIKRKTYKNEDNNKELEQDVIEGLMLGYKKFPDKYFDIVTGMEFSRSEINEHPDWHKQEYDNNGKIIYEEFYDGLWAKYEYDNNGNQIYYDDNNGNWEKREYDTNGNLIYLEDRNVGVVIDRRNRIQEGLMLSKKKYQPRYFDLETYIDFPKSEINKHPRWGKHEYDNNGNRIYYEDNDGNWVRWEYDNNGEVTYKEYSDGYWEKYEYDTDRNVIYKETSDRGVIFDYRNNIQEGLMLPYKKFPDRYFDWYTNIEFLKSDINEYSRWYKKEYDNNGNEIYIEFYDGDWIKYEYDQSGNLIYWEKDDGEWRKFEYDEDGNLIYYENSWNGVIIDIINEEKNIINMKKSKKDEKLESEMDEGTDISSVGSGGHGSGFAYIDPYGKGHKTRGTWAKNEENMYHKQHTYWPGGTFVKVKEKCKKFPYCNQGNTGALEYSNPKAAGEHVIKEGYWDTYDPERDITNMDSRSIAYKIKNQLPNNPTEQDVYKALVNIGFTGKIGDRFFDDIMIELVNMDVDILEHNDIYKKKVMGTAHKLKEFEDKMFKGLLKEMALYNTPPNKPKTFNYEEDWDPHSIALEIKEKLRPHPTEEDVFDILCDVGFCGQDAGKIYNDVMNELINMNVPVRMSESKRRRKMVENLGITKSRDSLVRSIVKMTANTEHPYMPLDLVDMTEEELNDMYEDLWERYRRQLSGGFEGRTRRVGEYDMDEELYEGRKKKKKWMQKANKSIEKRGTEGKCTPITKPGCTGRAKALAKTFKKMAKKRKNESISYDNSKMRINENEYRTQGSNIQHLKIFYNEDGSVSSAGVEYLPKVTNVKNPQKEIIPVPIGDAGNELVNKYKSYFGKKPINESGTPGISMYNKIHGESGTSNKAGVKRSMENAKRLNTVADKTENEKLSGIGKGEPKYGNFDKDKKEYDDEYIGILRGMGLQDIQYDTDPAEDYKERAEEAIKGSSRMGNNPEWANAMRDFDGTKGELGQKIVDTANKKKAAFDKTGKEDHWNIRMKYPPKEHEETHIATEGKTFQNLKTKKVIYFEKDLDNLIPESHKVEGARFKLLDGNKTTYELRWEGDALVVEGEKNQKLVESERNLFKKMSDYSVGQYKVKPKGYL